MNLIVLRLCLVSVIAEILSTITELQSEKWSTWSISLPEISSSQVLIELTITHSSKVPALLSVNQATAPSIDINSDGLIKFQGLSIDLTSFAYESPTCHISLRGVALDAAKLLVVGVLIPSLPNGGVTIRLAVYKHSKVQLGGEKCPFDCNGNGKCVNGGCECREPFIGLDCSQHYITIVTNEHKGLLVPPNDYVLFKSFYDSGQNLGFSVTLIQGEVISLMLTGK